MNFLSHSINGVKMNINNTFAGREPWQIVTITTASILTVVWIWDFLDQDEYLIERIKKTIFRLARYIPSVRRKIDDELNTLAQKFQNDIEEKTSHLTYWTELPADNLTKIQILQTLEDNLKLGGFNWQDGYVSGSVYCKNPGLLQLVTEVYEKTAYTNPLHSDVFPGICKMEAEVIRMTANLFRGDNTTCGTMTNGGTESILMVCKAYRDYGKETRGITRPEIILPTTAHSAFDKAAQFLRLIVRLIPIDPATTKVNTDKMRRAINSNTIMLVGSAPNFPYGTVDDIEAISDLGLRYNIPVHVDCCLGGFLTVFMDDAGFPIAPCDFRLPGVTSISADTHKYGYSPKGSSVVLYKDPKYRHYQYTVTTNWPGGVYGSPTVSGSRAGGNIACCWATMLSFGHKGYVECTRNIIHTAKYIEKGLRRINGIFIFGQPATSVIAIGSSDFDIFRLSEALLTLGWNLNPLQYPSGIHICVTHVHTQTGVADRFINDVQVSVKRILTDPKCQVEGKMAIYGIAQSIPDRSIVTDFTKMYLDSTYYTPK